MAYDKLSAYGGYQEQDNIKLDVDEGYLISNFADWIGLSCNKRTSNVVDETGIVYVVHGVLPSNFKKNGSLIFAAPLPSLGLWENEQVAFQNTPNKGVISAVNGNFTIRFNFPGGYNQKLPGNFQRVNTPVLLLYCCEEQRMFKIWLHKPIEGFGETKLSFFGRLVVLAWLLVVIFLYKKEFMSAGNDILTYIKLKLHMSN